ncbi:MAG: hypothetical protein KAT04_07095 [Methylococcales bacterium]|nr:hypothetical protein [Methylococcales bacterium]
MKINSIVDSFVKIINDSDECHIEACPSIQWIDGITNRLPSKFSPSFMSLISRYVFDDFEAGEIWFYANHGNSSYNELVQAIFRDEIIFKTTIRNGLIHFARPSDGSYDPICFDISKRNKKGEFQVVRLDHEILLQHKKITVKKLIASSLLEYMENQIKR